MHTLIVIGVGFLLLGACTLIGRLIGPPAVPHALLLFLPLWLIGASINLYIGVEQAGYSVADEAPIFLVVFAIPALVALLSWWKVH